MTTTDQTPEAGRLKPAELRPWWVASGILAVVVAGIAGLVLGPAQIGTWDVLVELVDRLPFIDTESGLGEPTRRWGQSQCCGTCVVRPETAI